MRRRMPGLGLILLLPGLLGCTDPDPIRQYKAPKPIAQDDSPSKPQDSVADFKPSPRPATERRAAWFFKVTGPSAAVVSVVEPFTQLVNTVRFGDDGRPTWKLPEGWTEQLVSGMRYATIQIPGDTPLELAVSSLSADDPTSTDYLLSNLNRWRGQLGLDAVADPEGLQQSREKGELQQLDSAGRRITLINLTGKTAEISEARSLIAMVIPDSGRTPEMPASRPAAPPAAPSADEPFTYTLPSGWTRAPLKTFQIAAFSAGDGANPLAISLSSVGGDLTANVNRWRGQAGLAEQTEQEIQEAAMPMQVDGIEAKYFIVQGAERSIFGVILQRDGQQWFIKADGPTAVAQKEREAFEAFAKSVKFK